jgi:hypothetical protein
MSDQTSQQTAPAQLEAEVPAKSDPPQPPTDSGTREPWYQNWHKVLGLGASAPVIVTLATILTNLAISKMEMHNRESERAQIAIERQQKREEDQRAFEAKLESDRRAFNAKLESEQLDRLDKYQRDKLARLDKLEEQSAQRLRDDEAKLRTMQTHYIDLALARTLCLDDKVRIFGYVAAVAKGDEKSWANRELDKAEKVREERDKVEEQKRGLLSAGVLEKLSRQLDTINLNGPGLASATEADIRNRAKDVIALGKRNEALKLVDIPCTGLPSGLVGPVTAAANSKP